MREHTIKVYQYEELSDAAKERAREWFREGTDNSWSEYTLEDAATCAEFLGINLRTRAVKLVSGATRYEPNIFFSGFCSQGDGACYEGMWQADKVNVEGLKEHAGVDEELHRIVDALAAIAAGYPEAYANLKHDGHYYHSGCMSVESESGIDSYSDEAPGEFERLEAVDQAFPEDTLIRLLRDFADWIYSQLEKEYDYQNADEQVAESIVANEYDFLENGKRFR